MVRPKRPWLFFVLASVASTLGVFVLPFFFPPAVRLAVSVSAAAGFNNKVAAVAAALCAVAVLIIAVRRPEWAVLTPDHKSPEIRRVPLPALLGLALAQSACSAFMCSLVFISGLRYAADAGYFIGQMTSHAIYNRQLYTAVEFPYGPLLFYGPIGLHSLLATWHVSVEVCYFVFLVLNEFVGVLLLGYLVNNLAMSRKWKVFIICCFAIFALEPQLGLNYTLFRFVTPAAALVFCSKRRHPASVAVMFALGELLNLAISPEMGFAFGSGAMTYALMKMRSGTKPWILAMLAPPLGCGLFLLIVGLPYLRMIVLMAGGTYNFIVEPVPHVLVVLFAVVWLIPRLLAGRLSRRDNETVLLQSCFVLSMALLPVAFGRADPLHVFFDGIIVILLSLVAMTSYARWKQLAWGTFVAVAMLLGYSQMIKLWKVPIIEVLYTDAALYPDSHLTHIFLRLAHKTNFAVTTYLLVHSAQSGIDPAALRAIVGNDQVATPLLINLKTENQLKEYGWYRPEFYFAMFEIFDDAAEQRKIAEFNEAKWALLPTGTTYFYAEGQDFADRLMGVALPYRSKHPAYGIGDKFMANLRSRWQAVGTVNQYTVFRRRS